MAGSDDNPTPRPSPAEDPQAAAMRRLRESGENVQVGGPQNVLVKDENGNVIGQRPADQPEGAVAPQQRKMGFAEIAAAEAARRAKMAAQQAAISDRAKKPQ